MYISLCSREMGRTHKTKAQSAKETWGLGLEHEFAPMMIAADGRRILLDPYAIVQLSRQGQASGAADTAFRVVVQIPSHEPPVNAKCAPKAALPDMNSVDIVPSLQSTFITVSACNKTSATDTHTWSADDATTKYADKLKQAADKAAQSVAGACKPLNVTHATFSMVIARWGVDLTVTGVAPSVHGSVNTTNVSQLSQMLMNATAPYCRQRRRTPVAEPGSIDADSGFVEVRSDKFERATIASVSTEVLQQEKRVLELAQKVADGLDVAGGGTVTIMLAAGVAIGYEGKDLQTPTDTYAGSFHVWITLPHKLGPKFNHMEFVQQHAKAITGIQWLEPLIHACMPPDPRSPGTRASEYSKSSMRSRMNSLFGLGVANMQKPLQRSVLCYSSLDALNRGDPPHIVKTDAVWLKLSCGARINLLACSSQDRWAAMSDHARVTPLSGSSFPIHQHGTDIRFDTCGTCLDFAEVLGDTVAFVKTEQGIEAATHRRKETKYKLRACAFKLRGFEVRLFDHMPGHAESTLLSLVVLACASSQHATSNKRALEDPDWVLTAHNCSAYGSRAPVTRAFLKRAAAALGVQAPKSGSTLCAITALQSLLDSMHVSHSQSAICQKFGYTDKVVFPDVNFEGWNSALNARLAVDTQLSRKLDAVKSDVGRNGIDFLQSSIATHLGTDWQEDVYMLAERITRGQ